MLCFSPCSGVVSPCVWSSLPLHTEKNLQTPILYFLYYYSKPITSLDFSSLFNNTLVKSTGRDRSWTGDNAACGRCHFAHAAWSAHVPYILAPESWREYPARTSLVSPLHAGVVSRHARATLNLYPPPLPISISYSLQSKPKIFQLT